MGDGITSTFDAVLFVLISVGVPALIFGSPLILLAVISERRKRRLQKERTENPPTEKASSWRWVFVSFTAMLIVYALSGLSLKMLLMN